MFKQFLSLIKLLYDLGEGVYLAFRRAFGDISDDEKDEIISNPNALVGFIIISPILIIYFIYWIVKKIVK